MTKTLDKGGYNDTIIKQLSVADLEILDRVWDKEIQGRKEFGYPQVHSSSFLRVNSLEPVKVFEIRVT